MSSFSDSEYINQLFVAKDEVKPELFGRGPIKINGSTYLQCPVLAGKDDTFATIVATVMIGPLENSDSPTPIISGAIPACSPSQNSPYSLAVSGPSVLLGPLDVDNTVSASGDVQAGGNIIAVGEVKSQCGGHILSAKKNFDIPHPSKEGWRLRHTCPEGPSNDVYCRGRVRKTEIDLPSYWKDFVDFESITVNLTPIGSHQHVIIKRIDDEKVYLQSNGGMPIDCFYHIFAERKDGEKLIPEYQGETPSDYPGNNKEYSVSGYHYDVKEN